MYNENDIHNTLNQVLNSDTFKKSTTTKVLLKNLVESTLNDSEISAFSVGSALFGERYDPEKSDVNVRVNISHLRKRLKHYYENEGSEDAIVLSIAPGQYKVTFSTVKIDSEKSTKRYILLGVGTVITIMLVSLVLFRNRNQDQVWRPIFDNGLETTLYLGNVFGYSGPNHFGHNGWHRDTRINSLEEFHQETKGDSEKYKVLKVSNYSYVVFENAFNIKPFTQYFTTENYDFSLRPSSEFKTRSIKDGNTIYAGPIYTQTTVNGLFNRFSYNVHLSVKPDSKQEYSLNYTDSENNKKSIFLNSRGMEGEYAIASGFNGPNNTRHYIFYSNHGMGLTAVVEYFTDAESLERFSKEYMTHSDEFVALFFVKGKDRTDISIELVLFDDNK